MKKTVSILLSITFLFSSFSTVLADDETKEIKLTVGSTTAVVDGKEETLDTAPTIINNRTMLPIRFITENLGLDVNWDAETKTITITIKNTSSDNNAIVNTKLGKIQGTLSNGIYKYLGIPYAEAKEKFVKATPIKQWDGILKATEYGKISPQFAILGIGENDAGDGKDNNCQNLNIWTPSINDNQKRPVMVWLHGGGFSTGSANEAGYDGEELSKNGDVVVVGVNHRLNVFGHLDLTAYGDKYKNSDNIGMDDIIEALKWVQENIDKFGGDPNNVTIFGQSGGGAKVLAMMTSPEAKGLFQKAIVQSGATENMGVNFLSKDISRELGALTLKKLGISENNVDAIQNKSNVEIMDAAGAAQQELANKYKIPVSIGDGYSLEWEPVVDGDFLPTNPVTEKGFADAGKNVPLLIGSNLNEWTTIMPTTAHNNMTDKQKELYSKAYPSKSIDEAQNVDTLIRLPMLKIMSHKADQNGAPVYSYVFTKQDEKMGSYHGLEIPYIFRSTDDKTLSNTISTAWVNFAKTGVPSSDNLPKWEPYTRKDGATMLLDDTSTLVHNHDKELISSLTPDYNY